MPNLKAQAAKDNGNIAFKSGDYPTAIGHYTTAILADKSDVIYPLNRAAAYLKLGKNEDAERDCTRVLELSSDNVKALFRRSQARTGMGNLTEAHQDLLKVLRIEPSNQPAQEELGKVVSLIEKEKSKKSNKVPTPTMQASLNPSLAHKRRRVPIKIIEPPTLLPPANSTNGASKTNSFKDAKQARETAKPSRVGGGIFRASGSNTIFTRPENGDSTVANPNSDSSTPSLPTGLSTKDHSKTAYTPVPKAPNTLFDFVRLWGSLHSTEEKWQFINSIPPNHFPALCKTSLEPSMLVSIMETFLTVLDTTKSDSRLKTTVQEYMENFAKIPRFNTLVLFLSKSEKALAKSVWTAVGVNQPTGVWSGVV